MSRQVHKNRLKLMFAVGLLIVGGLFLITGIRSITDDKIPLITRVKVLSVERANNPEKLRLGLSNREALDGIDGMLFIFNEASLDNCFWMKDTLIPLDMVFINDEKRIVTVHSNVQPDTYPEKFCPSLPVRYGLEVPAGNAEAWRLQVGEDVTW